MLAAAGASSCAFRKVEECRASATVKASRMCGPGCPHASTSTRGSISFCCERRDDHLPLRLEPCFKASIVYDAATHVVQLRSVAFNDAFLCVLSFIEVGRTPGSRCAVLVSVFVGVENPRCRTWTSSRIFALIRNSMTSSGTQSGPSFVVSHSAFSFPLS